MEVSNTSTEQQSRLVRLKPSNTTETLILLNPSNYVSAVGNTWKIQIKLMKQSLLGQINVDVDNANGRFVAIKLSTSSLANFCITKSRNQPTLRNSLAQSTVLFKLSIDNESDIYYLI